jgi:hypothetical protein
VVVSISDARRVTALSADHTTDPPRRLVVLGASNVALALPTLVAAARALWGGPLDVLLAFGHGRSYGMRMPLLWRELPGIIDCGLWRALEGRPPAPTAALLTDIGNDLLYEVPVPAIAAWVETCLDRLEQAGARVAMTSLPMRSVSGLSPSRFRVIRSIFFPRSQLRYDTILGWARELDERLRRLARERGAILVEPRPEWYGFDPIHIRRGRRAAAWLEMLSALAGGSRGVVSFPPRLRRSPRLWLLKAEQRWVFGRERYTAQPTARLHDGTTLALY